MLAQTLIRNFIKDRSGLQSLQLVVNFNIAKSGIVFRHRVSHDMMQKEIHSTLCPPKLALNFIKSVDPTIAWYTW